MNRIVLTLLIALQAAAFADEWREATFEDQTVVKYAPGNSDYHDMHSLRFTLSGQRGAEDIGATLGWYQPGLFNATIAMNMMDVSLYLFGRALQDSMHVTLKSSYIGNNTTARYQVELPITKGFEHGPHLALTFNTSKTSSGGPIAEYAVGYTATFTRRSIWKQRTGSSNEISRAGAMQNNLHLDLLLLPTTKSATEINTIAARIYLDGVASVMGSERWGLYYLLGTGHPLSQNTNTTAVATSLDASIPYPDLMVGLGIYFGFL